MPATTKQASLFDDIPPANTVVLAGIDEAQSSNPAFSAFQKLIRQIRQLNAEISAWEDFRPRYNKQVSQLLLPRFADLQNLQMDLIRQMDAHYQARGRIKGKIRRQILAESILEQVQSVLDETQDEATIQELTLLHDRYSDLTLDELDELDKMAAIAMAREGLGIELDDEDLNGSPEDILIKLIQKAEESQTKAAAATSRRPAAKAATTKQAQEKAAQLSVRDIYRRLASTLHPDRSSEHMDAETKTAMMQRVNQAYETDNLFELLNIQVEIAQTSPTQIGSLDASQIKHYVQALRKQARALKTRCESLRNEYAHLIPHHQRIRPTDVEKSIQLEARKLDKLKREIIRQIDACKDPAVLIKMLDSHD